VLAGRVVVGVYWNALLVPHGQIKNKNEPRNKRFGANNKKDGRG